jgi:hypothetical protein
MRHTDIAPLERLPGLRHRAQPPRQTHLAPRLPPRQPTPMRQPRGRRLIPIRSPHPPRVRRPHQPGTHRRQPRPSPMHLHDRRSQFVITEFRSVREHVFDPTATRVPSQALRCLSYPDVIIASLTRDVMTFPERPTPPWGAHDEPGRPLDPLVQLCACVGCEAAARAPARSTSRGQASVTRRPSAQQCARSDDRGGGCRPGDVRAAGGRGRAMAHTPPPDAHRDGRLGAPTRRSGRCRSRGAHLGRLRTRPRRPAHRAADAASDPLEELRKPLLCYGGLEPFRVGWTLSNENRTVAFRCATDTLHNHARRPSFAALRRS